ncbi:MAG: SET domain-containing protein [Gemmatimonadota bacterium]
MTAEDEQPFEVRGSGIQGRGGFAMRRIRRGERIIEYTGERISAEEADRRYEDEAMDRHHTFLFSVSRGRTIDAAVGGNDARFINHSCEPNCEAIEERARIFIDAIRTIESGEELTYDYAYARDASTTEEEEKRYACGCGSVKCRGTILEPAGPDVRREHHVAARQPHHARVGETRRGSRREDRNKTGVSARSE